jgi:hypothetical protein
MLKKRQEYRAARSSRSSTCARKTPGSAKRPNDSRNDSSAIEDLARRELGLIKPGEKLFILKDVPQTDARRPK